jgi:undecaprenyl-diphosphatase
MTEINIFDILIIIVNGIIEGITEWLPVSSTGHMLIFDAFIPLKASEEFKEVFFVVIQLGAILAVVTVFFKKMMPFWYEKAAEIPSTIAPVTAENGKTGRKWVFKRDTFMLWVKIAVACIPSAVIGVIADDFLEEHFGSPITVAIMLVVYGVAFIVVEKLRKGSTPNLDSLENITFKTAILIGLFQVLSMIPGTSRSGATIIGALILGVSRTVAAEFTFFLALPTMIGASLLKILKHGFVFTSAEVIAILIGMIVAYVVSLIAIKFLMDFVKKHSFAPFGVYRIILGAAVILWFALR